MSAFAGLRCLNGHDDLKFAPERRDREAKFIGLQPDGDGGLLEMWNHDLCGSTFCRETKAADRAPAELQALADRYARHCNVGDVLQDDDRYYWPFATHVPAALCKRGLHLEHAPGGWRVCLTATHLTLVR